VDGTGTGAGRQGAGREDHYPIPDLRARQAILSVHQPRGGRAGAGPGDFEHVQKPVLFGRTFARNLDSSRRSCPPSPRSTTPVGGTARRLCYTPNG